MAQNFKPEFVDASYQTIAMINRVWEDGQNDSHAVELDETTDAAVLATRVPPHLLAWYSLYERISVTLRHPDVAELRQAATDSYKSGRGQTFTIHDNDLFRRSEETRFVVDRDGDSLQLQNKSEILGGAALSPYMSSWLGALTKRGRYGTSELTELQKMLPKESRGY